MLSGAGLSVPSVAPAAPASPDSGKAPVSAAAVAAAVAADGIQQARTLLQRILDTDLPALGQHGTRTQLLEALKV